MLDCTDALAALLETCRADTSQPLWWGDLYTFIDLSGDVIARWTDRDIDLSYKGNTWSHSGPGIARGQITRQTGTTVSELSVTLYLRDDILIDGVTAAAFIANNGFLSAVLQMERAYSAGKGQPIVGTLPKFKGRITQLKDAGRTQATVVASNWMSLLNVQVPVNTWQPPCLHTVFDSGCGLNRVDFAQYGVAIGGSDTLNVFTDLDTLGAGYLNLGKIVFRSGANKGLVRSIKVQNAGGAIALVRPLPVAPSPGDTFVSYPGCDLTETMCIAKFNNKAHFWGFPYVPLNEVAAP